MISAVLLINAKGDIVISRVYRDDVTINTANSFRMKVIAAKETGSEPPLKAINKTHFMYIRYRKMFFVAVTTANANASMCFEFLMAMINIFKGYFGDEFDEGTVRDNFTLVYELLDEILDFGYPQTSSLEVLKMYINLGSQKKLKNLAVQQNLSNMITGALDWRRDGIRYKNNRVFIDVLESVNILMSQNGTLLRSDVTGLIKMKAELTGMPECKFGLNDKLLMDRDAAAGGGNARARRSNAVELEDCAFHRCVRLRTFDTDRTITFVPPDGEFELMRYRITDNINLPFRIIPVIEEREKTSVAMNIKAIANFSEKLFATNVVITIPTPPNTARCKLNVGAGRAKYEPERQAIVWRIRRFPGEAEYSLRGNVSLIAAHKGKAWARTPIRVQFQVAMFTASGLQVRSLKVFERSSYATTKWVRYITKAGNYHFRT